MAGLSPRARPGYNRPSWPGVIVVKELIAPVCLSLTLCFATASAATPSAAASGGDVASTPASPRPDPCAEPKREGKKAAEKKTPATGKSP